MKITLEFSAFTIDAQLNDSPTSIAIIDALPYNAILSTWGNEIYFEMPVVSSLEPHA